MEIGNTLFPISLTTAKTYQNFITMELAQTGPEYWIKREYVRRKNRNPAYSLRAFSYDLGVSPSRLSQVLSGKRKISRKMAIKVFDHIELNPTESSTYIKQLAEKSRSTVETQSEAQKFVIDQKSFELVSDPLHFTILSLVETDDFQSDPEWIAKRLNADVITVRSAIENLIDLKYLKQDGRKLSISHLGGVQTTDHQLSRALRIFHKKQLGLSIDRLDSVPIEFRDFTSEFMAIDPALLPEAKKLIRQFRKKLSNLLESQKKIEVYQLCIQLVPLSQLDERKL